MTSATKTKTATCKSVSYFGDKCEHAQSHTKRHTWDTNDYRRRKWADQGKATFDGSKGTKLLSSMNKSVVVVNPVNGGPINSPATPSVTAQPKASGVSEVIDVMISFDTTGSMYSCLQQVRNGVDALVRDLFKDIPDLRIGVIAHGDYCDKPIPGKHWGTGSDPNLYVTKMVDLSRDVNKLTQFVKTVGRTNGGDNPECYELVLREARTKASWEHGRNKVLVMIGDDEPHRPEYPLNTQNIDWRKECESLAAKGVSVYTVQCLNRSRATNFYKETAERTGGYHLKLSEFNQIRDLIKAVCYKQQGDERLREFERTVEHSGRMSVELSTVFSTLLGRKVTTTGGTGDGLFTPVKHGRFQVINVLNDISIKDLTQQYGLVFKTGRGFYQFTQRVEIQKNKDIVMRDDSTGAMFTGQDARTLLGLPPHCSAVLSPEDVKKLHGENVTVFIQSTSNNRKILAGTQFLYEV